MNIMPIVILVVMFFMGMNRKHHGVVNYKFTIERIVLTLVIMPGVAGIIKTQLSAFMPVMISAIIGLIFGTIIVFLIITFILGKIAGVPEYEFTGADRFLGFIMGVLKGFVLVCAFILFYGLTFLDLVIPNVITSNVKNNFANSMIENSVEYYRYSIYKVYYKMSQSGVSDLYKGKSEMLKEDKSYMGSYVKWTERSDVSRSTSEPEEEKKSDE